MTGNRIYALLLIAITALILASMSIFGAEIIFKLWNIPTLRPAFADLRILPGSAESFRQGFDPAIENPADPFKRYFNYPKIWYIFFYSGITQNDIPWMAAILLLMFFFALLLFPGNIQTHEVFIFIPIIFSPAVMLAIERGNVDLFIFFICALALVLMDYSALASVILLIIASLFKLFPFFGTSIFLVEKRPRFLKFVAGSFGTLAIYSALTYQNIVASFSYTEKGADLSYGVNVIPLHIQSLSNVPQLFALLSPISYLILIVLFVTALMIGTHEKTHPGESPTRNLNAFRMGATIYIGTFFLGNNWDYRLIFLLFTVPQLCIWARKQNPVSTTARWTLLTIFLSTWYLILVRIFGLIPSIYQAEFAFAVDELANWSLFVLLTLLMVASSPEWLRAEFRTTFSKRLA